MKNIIAILSLLCAFSGKNSWAQIAPCCPGIGWAHMIPNNPTKIDTVRIALAAGIPTPGKKISITHIVSNDSIIITACYALTSHAAQPTEFYDTLLIGTLPEETYTIYVKGYYGTDTASCINFIDSSKGLDTGIVYPPESVPWVLSKPISIYPNPTTGEVNISLPDGIEIERITVLGITGRVVKTETASRFSITELPAGLYILQVQTNRGRVIQKLRKM